MTELTLDERKYARDLEFKYFEQAIDIDRPPVMRQRVLRFLVGSELISESTREWAERELEQVRDMVEEEKRVLEQEKDALTTKLNESERQLKELRDENDVNPTRIKIAEEAFNEYWQSLAKIKRKSVDVRVSAASRSADGSVKNKIRRCKKGTVSVASLLGSSVAVELAKRTCEASAARQSFGPFDISDRKARWSTRAKGGAFKCECKVE